MTRLSNPRLAFHSPLCAGVFPLGSHLLMEVFLSLAHWAGLGELQAHLGGSQEVFKSREWVL